MALILTAKTRSLIKQINKNPNVVLEVDGVGTIYGSSQILQLTRWDQDGVKWDQDGIFWDGSSEKPGTESLISLSSGTSNKITQQIYPDKKGSSSISSVNVQIIDEDKSVAREFSFDNITEILGKKANFYLGFKQGNYPEDYIPVYRGIVTDYYWQGGACNVTISSPEALKRQDIFPKYNSTLSSSINSTQTTITVTSTNGFIESSDSLTSYIRIGDEIMEVTSVDSTTQFTVVRERLGTIGSSATAGDEVVSFYVLEDENPLDLALKIMLSDPDNEWTESGIVLEHFEYVSATESIENAFIFDSYDIGRITGLVAGDIVQVDGYGDYTVARTGKTSVGTSFIEVEEGITEISGVNATWRYKSKYNVLNEGLAMKPFEVDVESFEDIKSFFAANFTGMTFYLRDTIENAKEFIDSEIFYVNGMYSIPKNAKSSVRFLSPPLSIEELPTLDQNNILNIEDLRIRRSGHKYLYNRIFFEFNEDVLEESFLSVYSTLDTDSTSRIQLGKKQLKISSKGFKRNSATLLVLERLTDRFLDRYKFAPTYISGVKVPYGIGFNLDVGDVVFFGGDDTQLVNFQTGERDHPLDQYEIVNKSLDIRGEIELDLVSTGFAINALYGVISPSSEVQAGATTTKLPIAFIMTLDEFTEPSEYWANLVGIKVRVYRPDFSEDETTTFTGLDAQNPNTLVVDALSFTPQEGDIVELAKFTNLEDNAITERSKIKYVWTNQQSEITSVVSESEFDIDDTTLFFEGGLIEVHTEDYTTVLEEATIDTIVGNTITLNAPLSVLPVAGYKIEQINFENQDGYKFL